MSLRKFVLNPEKQKKFDENKKVKHVVEAIEEKNRYIPKADIDMLVLDKYEKDFEE